MIRDRQTVHQTSRRRSNLVNNKVLSSGSFSLDPTTFRGPVIVRRLRYFRHVTNKIDRVVRLLDIDELVDQERTLL